MSEPPRDPEPIVVNCDQELLGPTACAAIRLGLDVENAAAPVRQLRCVDCQQRIVFVTAEGRAEAAEAMQRHVDQQCPFDAAGKQRVAG